MKARIIKIGNSQGIRIPKPMLEESGIDEEVDLILQKKQLVIRAIENPREGWEAAFTSDVATSNDHLFSEYESIKNQWDEEEWQW